MSLDLYIYDEFHLFEA